MTPLHPMIVHFPLAVTFLLPILILIFAWMIKTKKMKAASWLVIIFLQLSVVVSGYVAIETGENEEDRVEKVVSKKLIHEHEDASKVFVGSVVVLLAVSIGVYFMREEKQFPVQVGLGILAIASCLLAVRSGKLGGELVYEHGAAGAYVQEVKQVPEEGLLPTPGMNTSESPMPVDEKENESYKKDDNDYGGLDSVDEYPDEEGDE